MRNIKEIEEALKLHSSYSGNYSGVVWPRGSQYLTRMDQLAHNYKGTPSMRLSTMLADYYEAVGVSNLDEAFKRLRDKEQYNK